MTATFNVPDMQIEQALYGESRSGHSLLASSGDDAVVTAIIQRLDLPDTAPPDAEWSPFLRGFPYQDRYVLSRTFHDTAASRGGMVFSHAVLAPMDVDRRRRLTPRNCRESTCCHADQRPICALNNRRRHDFRPAGAGAAVKEAKADWLREMATKLDSEEGRELYRLRQQTVEPVFGVIKAVQRTTAETGPPCASPWNFRKPRRHTNPQVCPGPRVIIERGRFYDVRRYGR